MKVEHNLQPWDKVKIKFTDSDIYHITTIISIYDINGSEIQISYIDWQREYTRILSWEVFTKIFRGLYFDK